MVIKMKEKVFITSSSNETRQLAEKLGTLVFPNTLITLNGQLGAGKTTFTQGLAKGLGLQRKVTSPTFNILKIYKGRLPLYHIDAYRLEDIDQDLGFEEYIDSDGVCVIEWSDFLPNLLPDERMNVSLEILEDDSRKLTFSVQGEQYERLLEELCTL